MGVRIAIAALAATAVLASSALAAPRYAALGDSYAAGPLIPLQLPPFGCLKSSNNYAHLAQLTLAHPEFAGPPCSGAEPGDMPAPQNVPPGPTPPQFDSLTADTALVTLEIGGNDIG